MPTAIVGAEEQLPIIARIDRFHAFGAPYLPVPLFPFPLPVHYHVRYGEPLALHERFPGDPRDPGRIREAAAEVAREVQALIDGALRERKGVFR